MLLAHTVKPGIIIKKAKERIASFLKAEHPLYLCILNSVEALFSFYTCKCFLIDMPDPIAPIIAPKKSTKGNRIMKIS